MKFFGISRSERRSIPRLRHKPAAVRWLMPTIPFYLFPEPADYFAAAELVATAAGGSEAT